MEIWCALLAVLACLSGVWSGVGVTQIQFKIVLKRVRSVQFACLIGSAASSFSSVSGTGAKCLHSVHSVQFTNSSGLGLDLTRAPVGAGEILSPIPDFLDSSKMEADIDAKFSVPSPASIWRLSLKFQEISVDN